MRNLCFVLCCGLSLFGCQSKINSQQSQTLNSTLKPILFDEEPTKLQQYRIGLFSVGGWVNQSFGQKFQIIEPRNPNAAVVYLFRPDSKWNREEIIASNLFINGQRIPSLLNNAYYWIEVPEGTYRISTSRPLGINHFQKPKYIDFSVEAGQSYFIKYDEENLNTRREISGPLIILPESKGLNEIAFTQLKSESYNFVAQDQMTGQVRTKAEKIKPKKYDPSTEIQLEKPFKIWNPLTW